MTPTVGGLASKVLRILLEEKAMSEPVENKSHGIAYKKGDFIGQKYEVHDVLGKGGCGIVYLVYSHEIKHVFALKTFRDEYIKDASVRERFKKEAQIWVNLDRHPYLVRAYIVDEISGRLYVALDYIPRNEMGCNTLEDYLKRRPPDPAQSLKWAIQFCFGMEHAYSKGVRAHRDIKPANILIDQNMVVKISDFGLAGILPSSYSGTVGIKSIQKGGAKSAEQTVIGTGFGTPTHMSPEQFTNAAGCDERSDIYSFGIVLYQMASGGKVPFYTDNQSQFWWVMQNLHNDAPVPKLNSPLFSTIQGCLEKDPSKRYSSFKELRRKLEPLLKSQTREVISPPALKTLEAWEWNNKGISLDTLGHFNEAIHCFDKVLEIDKKDLRAWINKGNALFHLRKFNEAILCCDNALKINKKFGGAWAAKGQHLGQLGHFDEAILCFNRAIAIDQLDVFAWYNKGKLLEVMRRLDESLLCYDKILKIAPSYANGWIDKSKALAFLHRPDDAMNCINRALEIEPLNANALGTKGFMIFCQGNFEEAMGCFNTALEINPREFEAVRGKSYCLWEMGKLNDALLFCKMAIEIESSEPTPYFLKAMIEDNLGKKQEAIMSYQEYLKVVKGNIAKMADNQKLGNKISIRDSDKMGIAEQRIKYLQEQDSELPENADKVSGIGDAGPKVEATGEPKKNEFIAPKDAPSWHNKGLDLYKSGNFEEAIYCFHKVIELTPKDSNAWYNKGLSLHGLGRFEEAVHCFDKVFEINPRSANTWIAKGLSLQNIGSLEEAIRCYDKAIELAPQDAIAWHNKGFSLERLNRLEEAIKCYDKALEVNAQFVISWYGKALVCEKQGQIRNAVESYKQFILKAPTEYPRQVEYARKRLRELKEN